MLSELNKAEEKQEKDEIISKLHILFDPVFIILKYQQKRLRSYLNAMIRKLRNSKRHKDQGEVIASFIFIY